jgi:hypothetical protein
VGSANRYIVNFLDPIPPRLEFMHPPDGTQGVPAVSEITLTFNRRPLHPATVTSTNIRLTMVERQGVALQRTIGGQPIITQSHDSVTVEFRPTFPLADDATYELDVDRRVQDLVGNDVIPYTATFSVRDEPFRFTDLTLTFTEEEKLLYEDPDASTASWNEAVEDALAALFTIAGGNGTAGNLTPTANQNFTPDDFARGVEVVYVEEDGIEYDVYNFRVITIPQNVTVRFSQRDGGPNRPVVLLSLKPVQIDGILTVSGGNGEVGNGNKSTYQSTKALPAVGGAAGTGRGDGADNYSGTKNHKSAPKMDGEDVLYGGEGGKGGGSNTGTYYYSYGAGGGGGGSREDGEDGKDTGYTYYPAFGGDGGLSAVNRGYPANLERKPNVGGAGGAAGGMGGYTNQNWLISAASAGGGGGGITIQSAGSVTIGAQGQIRAVGGNGGDLGNSRNYFGGCGGGGAGGSILIRATSTLLFELGSTLDVAGGTGGQFTWTYTYYLGSQGGDGGGGYIRLEALEDENAPGKPMISGLTNANLTYSPVSQGIFAPKGGGAPSIGQTVFVNLGVYDPQMIKPSPGDIAATLFNDTLTLEVQMAVEDTGDLGNPDLGALDITDLDGDGERDDTLDETTLSEWVPLSSIESLNGMSYQFIRVRMTFQLDPNQTVDQPIPFLDRLTVPFKF